MALYGLVIGHRGVVVPRRYVAYFLKHEFIDIDTLFKLYEFLHIQRPLFTISHVNGVNGADFNQRLNGLQKRSE